MAKAMIDPLSGEPVFFEARDPLEGVVGKAAQLGTMPRLTGTGRGHTAEGSNVSHANRLSHTRHKPHRNPTGKLFVLHHGRRSKSGSGMGR